MREKQFKKIQKELFSQTSTSYVPLVVFEIANNHMGDVRHAMRIMREIHRVAKEYPFHFGFKFQRRSIPSYIHPDYRSRMDISYIKRFTETALSVNDMRHLVAKIDSMGCISICTPFDEEAVDFVEMCHFNIIKIASASFTDWSLLEKISRTQKPLILSTATTALVDIDRVVSFLRHREKNFALLHCVGEYPTAPEHMELNQIDLFKARYPDTVIGFSTHEAPSDTEPVQLAVAKGARIFEKHVAVTAKTYTVNNYSAEPKHIATWLAAISRAIQINGQVGVRMKHSHKELTDIHQFQRGVFLKRDLKKGEALSASDTYFAFPSVADQLLANDMSKYTIHTVKKDIKKDHPLMKQSITSQNVRNNVLAIVKDIKSLITKSTVPLPSRVELEISHHYGIDSFYRYGATIVNVVNREYCKKLILVLPDQTHPAQYHKKKEETYHIMYGTFTITLNKKKKLCTAGDVITIERGVVHEFTSKTGGILEEISSTHYPDDSYYVDKKITANKIRKTYLSYWMD